MSVPGTKQYIDLRGLFWTTHEVVEDVTYYNCLEPFFIDVWKLDLWNTGVYCACIHSYIKGKVFYVLSIETFLELVFSLQLINTSFSLQPYTGRY